MVADIVVPDLASLEVLRGARDETYGTRIERHLSKFDIVDLGGRSLAIAAARHYRHLRGLGITIRSSIDVLIGPFCIRMLPRYCIMTGAISSRWNNILDCGACDAVPRDNRRS